MAEKYFLLNSSFLNNGFPQMVIFDEEYVLKEAVESVWITVYTVFPNNYWETKCKLFWLP